MNLDALNSKLKLYIGAVIRPLQAIVVTAGIALWTAGQEAAGKVLTDANGAAVVLSSGDESTVSAFLGATGLDFLTPFAPLIVALGLMIKRKRDGQV